ncbi:hypothetical protein QZH41_007524 [Actinostola sp. cb2023]|nr:hypothetical protein QZH41_007524 [Actinostola sp. cb2023]
MIFLVNICHSCDELIMKRSYKRFAVGQFMGLVKQKRREEAELADKVAAKKAELKKERKRLDRIRTKVVMELLSGKMQQHVHGLFLKKLHQDIQHIENTTFSVMHKNTFVDVKFIFAELPNDMKMLSLIADPQVPDVLADKPHPQLWIAIFGKKSAAYTPVNTTFLGSFVELKSTLVILLNNIDVINIKGFYEGPADNVEEAEDEVLPVAAINMPDEIVHVEDEMFKAAFAGEESKENTHMNYASAVADSSKKLKSSNITQDAGEGDFIFYAHFKMADMAEMAWNLLI